jgi:hypothetical protein
MHAKASCDLKTTLDREDVLNDEYDFATWVYYQQWPDEVAKGLWWNYMNDIHASLFGGLRVGTDYDYENLLAIQGYGIR